MTGQHRHAINPVKRHKQNLDNMFTLKRQMSVHSIIGQWRSWHIFVCLKKLSYKLRITNATSKQASKEHHSRNITRQEWKGYANKHDSIVTPLAVRWRKLWHSNSMSAGAIRGRRPAERSRGKLLVEKREPRGQRQKVVVLRRRREVRREINIRRGGRSCCKGLPVTIS